jgi:Sulfotransferase family
MTGLGASAAHLQPGPVFIVGSMRSGSTLLRLILDSHPHLAIGPETGFMSGLTGVKEVPNWQWGSGWFERMGWSEDELDERLRLFYDGIFRRYAEQRGKQRWGEKTPFHTSHVAEMSRVFPDAVFVGIVRHPGAVAMSLHKKFHYTFGDAVDYWIATNYDLLSAASTLSRRFVLVRYEDLLAQREAVLHELMDAIGEPWHQNLLEHHEVQRTQGAPRVAEGSTVTRDPVDPTRAERWLDAVTAADRDALARTGGLAGVLGYRPLDVALDDLVPPGGPHRWLLGGDELARRWDGWRDRPSERPGRPAAVVEASAEQLAARLAAAEQALVRARARRAVRMVDAVRKVQRGRTTTDVRAAWAMLRGTGEVPAR